MGVKLAKSQVPRVKYQNLVGSVIPGLTRNLKLCGRIWAVGAGPACLSDRTDRSSPGDGFLGQVLDTWYFT